MTQREAAAKHYMEELLLEPGCKNPDGARMRYRVEHSLRVASLARQLARAEGHNAEVLVVACLLHDVAYAELGPRLQAPGVRRHHVGHGAALLVGRAGQGGLEGGLGRRRLGVEDRLGRSRRVEVDRSIGHRGSGSHDDGPDGSH